MATLDVETCPACGQSTCELRESKAGAVQFYCTSCKFQGFAKSPMAAGAVRARIAAKREPKTAPPAGKNKADTAPAPAKRADILAEL